MLTVHGIMAEGHWHSFHGRTGEALEAFERAFGLVMTSQCLNSHMIVVLAGAGLGLAAPRGRDPAGGPAPIRRAEPAGVSAGAVGRPDHAVLPRRIPVGPARAQRPACRSGEGREALRIADRSCAVAEGQRRYEHARSLLVRGRIAHQLGRPEAEEQIRSALAALDAIEATIAHELPRAAAPV